MARQAVDDYLTKVSESTLLRAPQPGLQPLRKELLEAALRYYQELPFASERKPTRPCGRTSPRPSTASVTSTTRSAAKARPGSVPQGAEIYGVLAQGHPQDAALQGRLADSLRRVADLLGETGKPAEALAGYEQAVVLAEAADPHRRAAYWAGQDLPPAGARRQHFTAQPLAARRSFERAIIIGKELADAQSDDVSRQRDLADSYNDLAHLYLETGPLSEALRASQQAFAITDRLSRAHPDSGEILASGGGHQLLRAGPGAAHRRSRSRGRRLLPAIHLAVGAPLPRQPSGHALPVRAGGLLVARQLGRRDLGLLTEGRRLAEQARQVLEGLLSREPDNLRYREHLANSYAMLGKIQRYQGQSVAAIESLLLVMFHDGAAAARGS